MPDAKMNVVLVNPEIPQNTGNIGRVCVNTDTRLHLVKPFSFSLESSYLKRAGLDYWEHLDLQVHESLDDFFLFAEGQGTFFCFSTRASRNFWDAHIPPGSFLLFGNESSGFPQRIYRDFSEQLLKIPMPGKHARSMNLANAVAVAIYELARRSHANIG